MCHRPNVLGASLSDTPQLSRYYFDAGTYVIYMVAPSIAGGDRVSGPGGVCTVVLWSVLLWVVLWDTSPGLRVLW
mgnify:CR=1 FL=1